MTPRRLVLLLLVIATIAAIALVRTGSADARLVQDVVSHRTAEPLATAIADAAPPTHAGDAPAPPSRLPVATTDDDDLGPRARIVGRCVGDHGAPLVGCTVSVRVWHLRHQGDGFGHSVHHATSDEQGRFDVVLQPDDPCEYGIDVRGDGLATVAGLWLRAQPGSTTDVGDLIVPRGARVHGRVVDAQGTGVPQVGVVIAATTTETALLGELAPARRFRATTSEQGWFAFPDPLPAGEHLILVPGFEGTTPDRLSLTTDTTTRELLLVVPRALGPLTIAGRVVDQLGNGVPVALVTGGTIGQQFSTQTDSAGRFNVQRHPGTPHRSLVLEASAPHYMTSDASRRTAEWGDQDVVLRLDGGAPLTVRVTDESGAPVESFWVQLVPVSFGGRLRPPGELQHADGIAEVRGLHAGSWLVYVDFPPIVGLQSTFVPLHTDATAPTRIDVVAHPPRERIVRVQFDDGRPAPASTVKVCDGFGKALRRDAPAKEERDWQIGDALVIFEALTDADGRARIRGPADRVLGIEVSGKRHERVIVDGIRLDGGDPGDELVVTVDRVEVDGTEVAVGERAALHGRITPPEVLDELRRQCGLARGMPFSSRHRAELQLRRDAPAPAPAPANQSITVPIDDDGAFSASDLPAGEFHVTLQCTGGPSTPLVAVGRLTLRADEATEWQLDLTWMLPGRLEATVRENGQPLRNRRVLLIGQRRTSRANTDAEGRLSVLLPPDTYRLALSARTGPTTPANAVVTRDHTTHHAFELWSAQLRVRLSTPEGEVAAGVPILVRGCELPVATTDEHGVATLHLDPGRCDLAVLPQRFDEQRRREEIRLADVEGRADPFAAVLVPVGEVTLQAGDDKEITLRLPPAWRD